MNGLAGEPALRFLFRMRPENLVDHLLACSLVVIAFLLGCYEIGDTDV
jgi:hypothetical protein